MSHFLEVFYSEHCPSCLRARAVARSLAARRADVVVIERDLHEWMELATGYHLLVTPALVIDGTTVMYGVPSLDVLGARVTASSPACDR